MRFTEMEIKKDEGQYTALSEFHVFAQKHCLTYWDVLNLSDTYKELIKNTPVNQAVDIRSLMPEPPKSSLEVLV